MNIEPQREMFWNINESGIFYFLAGIAILIFLVGIVNKTRIWRKLYGTFLLRPLKGDISRTVLDVVSGRKIFMGDFFAGSMHFFIFWGFFLLFIGTVFGFIDHYIVGFLKGTLYLCYSMVLDFAGFLVSVGVLWALSRRYLQRVDRLERSFSDMIFPCWLLLVVFSGFLVEGIRLGIQNPPWHSWSFVGDILTFSLDSEQDNSILYMSIWWTHALLSLGFIASIPYSRLFHILAAPAQIYIHTHDAVGAVESEEEFEIYSELKVPVVLYHACTRCGRCVDVCPAVEAGELFSPRDFILGAREFDTVHNGFLNKLKFYAKTKKKIIENQKDFSARVIWHCTTCKACLEVCPVYISIPESVLMQRARVIEEGTDIGSQFALVLDNLYKYYNPWVATRKKKNKWARERDVPEIPKKSDSDLLCYFVGCTTSIDTRAQNIAVSFTKIMNHCGVEFGILGKKEPCCGDIALRCGERGLFFDHKERTESLLNKRGVKKLVTSSPHCYHTISKNYKVPRNELESHPYHGRVFHYTQVLYELNQRNRLKPELPINAVITYHDPCYLGRYNGIYEEPRALLRAIPGCKFVEMEKSRENSFCCGGGGGRMWQEEVKGEENIAEIRIGQALSAGAEILVTTCPLCLIMLDDACKTAGSEDGIRVMDLNELLVCSLFTKELEE